jgi:hypothetical protein
MPTEIEFGCPQQASTVFPSMLAPHWGPLREYRRTARQSIVDADTENGQNGRQRARRTQGNPGAPVDQVARSCGA